MRGRLVFCLLAALPLVVGCAEEPAMQAKMAARNSPAGGANSSQYNERFAAGKMAAGPSADASNAASPSVDLIPAPAGVKTGTLGGRAYAGGGGFAIQQRAARVAPEAAKLSPNLYLSNGYIGGQGERDRIEKLISEGVLVEGKRVKLEAFARNYGQAFPIPTKEALAVTADTERTKIVEQGDHTYLQVGLQAMKGELPRRPPLNLALVIDCSGSMQSEGKIEAAIAASRKLVQALTPNDTMALVKFEDTVTLLAPSAPVRNVQSLLRSIDGLTPGGGTNIYAGMQAGFREVAKHAKADSVNRVIVLSDGNITAGVTDTSQFERLAAAFADQDIQTTTVGLGLDFNEDLMLAIAREGKGNYHFIKNSADTQTVFASELNELTHVVAKAVKLRVVLAPGVGFVRALGARQLDQGETKQAKAEEKKIDRRVADELGIPQNRNPDKDEPGIKLLIPSFYRGDDHVVMLEVAVPPGRGAGKIADVYLKYKDLVSRSNRDVRTACSVTYTPRRDEAVASVNRNVKKNLLGFQTGEALIAASELMDRGQYADAIRRVDERMAVLGVAAQQWHDRDLDHDGLLLNRYKTVLGQLSRDTALAGGEFGQYLKKSLSYAGYRMTR